MSAALELKLATVRRKRIAVQIEADTSLVRSKKDRDKSELVKATPEQLNEILARQRFSLCVSGGDVSR